MSNKKAPEVTGNAVVAWNLKKAREARGMSQREAGEKLAPYLGDAWTRQTNFSAAERTSGDRVRNFTADEILAFSVVFDLPIAWFFLPPEELIEARVTVRDGEGLTARELFIQMFGRSPSVDAYNDRISELFRTMPEEQVLAMDKRVGTIFDSMVRGIARRRFESIERVIEELPRLADDLKDLFEQAAAEATNTVRSEIRQDPTHPAHVPAAEQGITGKQRLKRISWAKRDLEEMREAGVTGADLEREIPNVADFWEVDLEDLKAFVAELVQEKESR